MDSKEIVQKKEKLKGMILGRSKSYKERDKYRTRLKNINKKPYLNKEQQEKHKDVKRRERESHAKHRQMYSK